MKDVEELDMHCDYNHEHMHHASKARSVEASVKAASSIDEGGQCSSTESSCLACTRPSLGAIPSTTKKKKKKKSKILVQ
jgi:hypothetical protein